MHSLLRVIALLFLAGCNSAPKSGDIVLPAPPPVRYWRSFQPATKASLTISCAVNHGGEPCPGYSIPFMVDAPERE